MSTRSSSSSSMTRYISLLDCAEEPGTADYRYIDSLESGFPQLRRASPLLPEARTLNQVNTTDKAAARHNLSIPAPCLLGGHAANKRSASAAFVLIFVAYSSSSSYRQRVFGWKTEIKLDRANMNQTLQRVDTARERKRRQRRHGEGRL